MAILQALGVTTVVFFLLRLLPGDPSFLLAGPSPTPDRIETIRQSLRLDRPLWEQFQAYLSNLMQGDWGRSITTGNNVLDDIVSRLPATIELVTLALVIGMLVSIPWATWSALRRTTLFARIGQVYGRFAGSIPDFWIATILILIFFGWLRWAPPPIGRLGVLASPPEQVTGLITIDSLISGDVGLAVEALRHLMLPALALIAVVTGIFYKITRAAVERELATTKCLFVEACGLSTWSVGRVALRNALPPVIAVIGNTYGYLMGGAVLIEAIFSWGGLGQYAVQAVQSSDYFAVTGVVLVASLFTLLVYLGVDVINMLLDPRTIA